jgi:CDP-diglyceride synthetase
MIISKCKHHLIKRLFSCGLWLTKDVGLLIGCINRNYHTLNVALFVIKNLKILITCWWGVFFLDNSVIDGLGRSICRASLLSLTIGTLWIGGIRSLISYRALLRNGSIPLSSWGSRHFGTTGTTVFLRCSFLMLLQPLEKLRN